MNSLREELCRLIAARALERRTVTLASGKTSNYYMDCKRVSLHPRGLFLISELFWQKLESFSPRPYAVGGPTLGADPLTAGLMMKSEIAGHPMMGMIIRKEAKGHGTGAWIEGVENVPAGSEVVLLEDVVTTAGSSLKAVARLREAGYRVSKILCIVDRQEGGEEAVRKAGLSLHALFTAEEVLACPE